jgi:OmpA-OmpF porin, OOP family
MKSKNLFVLSLFFVLLSAANIVFAENDIEGSKDHPLLSRLPNFYIQDYETKDFDQIDFADDQGNIIKVEGRKFYISYLINSDEKPPSEIQILRNFINAIEKIGGKKIFEGPNDAYLKLEKDGMTTYVHVRAWNQGEGCDLYIVEAKQMKQDVVADASSMANDINATGKVAIYGIYFDTNKTEIKPKSEPTMKEIANLLTKNSKLKLYIVGHTDNVGTLASNMDLSKRRAESVISYLATKHSVDAKRLIAQGVGPLAPVASNKTDDGKAKNRRVELVEQ